MAPRYAVPMNRNGVVGDYAAYASPRLSMDELVELSRARRSGAPMVREATILRSIDDYHVVRYRLGSREIEADMHVMDGIPVDGVPLYSRDQQAYTSVFGVLDEGMEPQVILEVIEKDEAPGIFMVYRSPHADVPNATMLEILRYLDLPPLWNAGADHKIAKMFDAWHDRVAGEWEEKKPTRLVRVTFERVCFSVDPVLTESTDVLVAVDPGQDIESSDENHAYWAKVHYREEAFEKLYLLPQAGVRPGFSSWMPKEEPVLVKVVGTGLESVLRELTSAGEPEESASPAIGR